MEDNKTMRPAIYARVSSDQQAKANTIASQLAALKERVQADGLSLDDELSFIDEGHSGSVLVRPASERLRDVAYAAGIDRLYVHSPDRRARKYAYQVLLVDELKRSGVEIVFLNHSLGATPEEDLLLQVQGMIAEYKRAKILERSRRGKRHAARRGSVNVLSGAPYGSTSPRRKAVARRTIRSSSRKHVWLSKSSSGLGWKDCRSARSADDCSAKGFAHVPARPIGIVPQCGGC